MSGDLYASLAGARAAWADLDRLGNNLANAGTTGFKADRIVFQVVGPGPSPLAQGYAKATPAAPDARDGTPVPDGVATHLALQGEGWFALRDGPDLLLTRDGRFQLDATGTLVDGGGRPLLGLTGPIRVPEGETVRIAQDGRVYGSESGELDQLDIVTAPVRALGGNLYAPDGPVSSAGARVLQGALEGSNVDPLAAMIDLVQASRYVEAFQKAMQASDELTSRLNQLGGR